MDRISPEKRSWNMSRIRSKDTSIELKVRKALYAQGLRFRVKNKLPGKPDIIFPSKKIAVFVHGCFWHLHGCKNSKIPVNNSEYWKPKLEKNVIRDIQAVKKLTEMGWTSITLWECEIKSDISQVIYKIKDNVNNKKI